MYFDNLNMHCNMNFHQQRIFIPNRYSIMKDSYFPISAQTILWKELTAKQQAEVAAVLRHMKKKSQERMCFALMDYILCGDIPEFDEHDLLLSAAFVFLTGYGMEEKAPWRIKTISSN